MLHIFTSLKDWC